MTIELRSGQLVVDLSSEAGKALGDLLLQTVWTSLIPNDIIFRGKKKRR